MYALFDKRMTASPAQMIAANWTNVRTGLQANLGQIIRYYRRQPMAVKSDHFLIRLLQSITVSKMMSTERYYNNVDGLFSLNLGMALGMTSELSKGRVHAGQFYGPDSPEIYVAHTADFDPFVAERNWQNLQPIRVLRHPRSDMACLLPNGKDTGSEYGLAVIAINIPMLAVQYRAWWRQEQYNAEQTGDSPHSINQFVHMYCLPNMLYSHLDYALFNRVSNTFFEAPQGEASAKHPFGLPDWEAKLDAVQTTMLEQLERVTKDWHGVLYNLPAVSQPSMVDVMRVPQVSPTRQVEWALALARFPAVDFLLSFSLRSYGEKNGQELNRIRQEIRSYRANSYFRQVLPPDLYLDAEYQLQRFADLTA